MGIDRIGKGGGPVVPAPQPSEIGGKERSAGVERPFEVSTERAGGAERVAPVAPSATALEELRTGRIDLNGYIERKLEEATEHLQAMRPAELDAIKRMLRDQISTDPALVELVRQATGMVPKPPEGD